MRRPRIAVINALAATWVFTDYVRAGANKRGRRVADLVTIVGMSLCWLAGTLLFMGVPYLVAGVIFSAGVACDKLDGIVARKEGVANRSSGRMLDNFADKLGEMGFFVGLSGRLFLDGMFGTSGLLLVATVFSIGTSYAGYVGRSWEQNWRDVRIFGRGIRAVLMGSLLVGAGIFEPRQFLYYGLWVLVAFNALTYLWRYQRLERYHRRWKRLWAERDERMDAMLLAYAGPVGEPPSTTGDPPPLDPQPQTGEPPFSEPPSHTGEAPPPPG